jgi:hypothetical protein
VPRRGRYSEHAANALDVVIFSTDSSPDYERERVLVIDQ